MKADACRYAGLRSTTFYQFTQQQTLDGITANLASMQAAGINTVWVVLPWATFNPVAAVGAVSPQYDSARFQTLLDTLALLSQHGMRAILPLNYLGCGWSPQGIDSVHCHSDAGLQYLDWTSHPEYVAAFRTYVQEFLTRIQAYSDMVYILFFTEGAEPGLPNGALAPADIPAACAELQGTLGRLPLDLPPTLRGRFLMGYHDYLCLGSGSNPLATATTYDFLSMIAYEDWLSTAVLESTLNTRAASFQASYPELPLILGESGSRYCAACGGSLSEEDQATKIVTMGRNQVDHHRGWNVWGWVPLAGDQEDYCTVSRGCGGLSLTRGDMAGTLRPAAQALKTLLRPSGSGAGVVTSYQPWAVSVNATNLNAHTVVQLFDHNGAQWGGDITVTRATDCTWLSFSLPSNTPPSGCNAAQPCDITLRLKDRLSGLVSDPVPLLLPRP